MACTTIAHACLRALFDRLPFDPVADFTHIGLLVEAPNVLLVKSESRFKTLAEYLNAAKTQPVRFGSSGIGSAPHLLGAMLSGEAKVTNLDHVPYRGSAPAMQDLMANQIESLIDPITTNVQLMKDGVLRALAVSSPQRLPAFPNVPTFAELGYPQLVALTWFSLSGPAGMPSGVVDKLNKEVRKIMQSQAAKDMLAKSSMETFDWDSARFTQYVGEELKQWAPMIKTVKPEN